MLFCCLFLSLSIDFKIQVKQIVMHSLCSITKQVSKVRVVVLLHSCAFSCSLADRCRRRPPFDSHCPRELRVLGYSQDFAPSGRGRETERVRGEQQQDVLTMDEGFATP